MLWEYDDWFLASVCLQLTLFSTIFIFHLVLRPKYMRIKVSAYVSRISSSHNRCKTPASLIVNKQYPKMPNTHNTPKEKIASKSIFSSKYPWLFSSSIWLHFNPKALAVKITLDATVSAQELDLFAVSSMSLQRAKREVDVSTVFCMSRPLTLSHISARCNTELSKCLLIVRLVRNQFTAVNTYIHTVLPMLVILQKPLSSCNFPLPCFEETSQGMRATHAGFPPARGSLQPLATSSLPHFLQGKSFGSLLPFDLQLGKTARHGAERKAWILHSSNLSY